MGIDPVSMAVIGGIGAGVSAYGQYESGQAALPLRRIRRRSPPIMQRSHGKMRFGMRRPEKPRPSIRAQDAALIGKEKAYAAASGIDVGTGSTTAVRAGTQEMGMLDNLTIRSDSAKKAYADEVQAGNFTAESQLDTMKSQQAAEAGDIGGCRLAVIRREHRWRLVPEVAKFIRWVGRLDGGYPSQTSIAHCCHHAIPPALPEAISRISMPTPICSEDRCAFAGRLWSERRESQHEGFQIARQQREIEDRTRASDLHSTFRIRQPISAANFFNSKALPLSEPPGAQEKPGRSLQRRNC